MTRRWAARKDATQTPIVEELRALGFDVDIVHREKKLYDLVVSGVPTWARCAVGVRVEIKSGAKDTLTKEEVKYWAKQKHGDNLIRAECAEDVLKWFGRD